MRIVSRYLAHNFILPFLLGTFFFVSFLLTFELFKITSLVVNKGLSFWIFLELAGHIAVSFLPISIPLSMLFATIYVLNKLSDDSEIIAMRSFGITKFQMYLPFLLLSILISSAVFSLNRNIIPYSKKEFRHTLLLLGSKGMLSDIKPEQFYLEIPDVTLFAEKVRANGTELERVFINMQSDETVNQIIFANHGTLIKKQDSDFEIPSLRLHLRDGNIYKEYKDTNETEKIIFEEYDFPVSNSSKTADLMTKHTMRTNNELWKMLVNPKTKQIDLVRIELEYWTRVNTFFVIIAFVLLGFSIGIKAGRGDSRNSGVIGLLTLVGYYIVFLTLISFARKGEISPIVAVFVPTILVFFVGGYFYRKLDWVS